MKQDTLGLSDVGRSDEARKKDKPKKKKGPPPLLDDFDLALLRRTGNLHVDMIRLN